MESMVFVGAKIDKETAENLALFVEKVFRSGKETGMDQSTIVHALSLVQEVAKPENVNISSNHFVNNP